MGEKGLLAGGSAKSRGLLSHPLHFATGCLTYMLSVLKLVLSLVTCGGNKVAKGSIERLAEVIKLVLLNIIGNLFPLYIDQKNASYMLTASPQNDLNVPCHID